jgi:hypothetical protein
MNNLQKTIKTILNLLEFGAKLTDEEIILLLNEDGSWRSDISDSISLICNRTNLSSELVSDFLAAYISTNNLRRRLYPKPQTPHLRLLKNDSIDH